MLRFHALEDFLENRYRAVLTDADIARLIDYPRDSIRRLRRDGLTVWQSDEIAIGLGVHPSRIWPDWWKAD